MSTFLHRSRIARIALLSGLAFAGITATTVASASADGDTIITTPPRPTHTCWSTAGDFGCENPDGSGWYCDKGVGFENIACIRWDSQGNTSEF